MIVRYRVLADRIEHELTLLNKIVQQSEAAMKRVNQNPADQEFYIAAAALHLHDFYNGLERLFEMIATEIDQTMPSGRAWHRELLTQMTLSIGDVRPSVLSGETAHRLEEYLRFRHVVRSVYALHLDAERIGVLVFNVGTAYRRVQEELAAFGGFLERLSRADG